MLKLKQAGYSHRNAVGCGSALRGVTVCVLGSAWGGVRSTCCSALHCCVWLHPDLPFFQHYAHLLELPASDQRVNCLFFLLQSCLCRGTVPGDNCSSSQGTWQANSWRFMCWQRQWSVLVICSDSCFLKFCEKAQITVLTEQLFIVKSK